jgi:predicted AlkP superfamily phosphohydrolase/phosphomutase
MTSPAKRKVLVLGLDGATWDVLLPLVEAGLMPNLGGLMGRGVSSPLVSLLPPVTATAWSSFVTGLNPGKHGVFEFLLRRKGLAAAAISKRNPFGEVPVNSTLRDGLPVWQIASRAGMKSVVVGIPITYPPSEINGLMISDFLTPYGKRDFTWPRSLLADLESRFGPYRLYHREVYSRRAAGRVIDELYDVLDFNVKVTRHLLATQDWNLFMSHFWGTDRAQHELWHVLDQDHPRHDPAEARTSGPRLKGFYEALDRGLGEITRDAGECDIIVASDHGFGPIHVYLAFNVWLWQRGYLKFRNDPATLLKRLAYRLGLTPVLFYRISMALGLARLRLSGGFHSRQKMQMLLNAFFLSLDNVDWARTTAYSRGNYGQIYVNLKGREPWGSVAPGEEYDRVRNSIRDDLLAAVDPRTGRPMFERVHLREELYRGPYVDEAPDLVFLPRDMRYKALGTLDFTSNTFSFPVYGNSGDHRLDGIFLGVGPSFRRAVRLDQLSIMDVAPTVLYLLGLGVPNQMDGRVMMDALAEERLIEHPVEHTDLELLGRAAGSALTVEDSEDIKRRLEGIGYIG